MAILGYLMFGSHTLSQVTLNLPTENLSSKIAIYTTMVNPIAKYALLVIPIVKAIERSVDEDGDYCSKKRLLLITMQRVLVRTSVVISTVIVAIAVPFFGYLMALVGALMNMTVSIIMPCLCFLKICRIYGRLRFGEVIVICWIVVIGVGIMIVGTYTAIMQIITHF
ncbi:unnamed protein product [Cuscuta europaea]|uniref:Amino acid transporter transmembrane domain-containing protein n=1 Tax=Cuscuta europaea TaxID=41803 RepID=A0A9P0Z8L5_CUSEU|nr:unnamed protein product [Cuscuta europaea]